MFCDGIWGLESFRKCNEQIAPVWPSWTDTGLINVSNKVPGLMLSHKYGLACKSFVPGVYVSSCCNCQELVTRNVTAKCNHMKCLG